MPRTWTSPLPFHRHGYGLCPVIGPVVGLVASGYIRLIGWVSHHRASGLMLFPAMLAAFGALGLIGFRYPQLFGNGQDMAHDAFLGRGALLLFLALFMLKPLVTSACLRSGAAGGLFTPTLSTGAVFGAFVGWPGPSSGPAPRPAHLRWWARRR